MREVAYGPFLGIDRATRPAIEASYEAFLAEFNRHLDDHAFLLGDRPTIGDFGFIAPLYAHLHRDPAPGALMRERAPNVTRWVERMIDPDPARDSLVDVTSDGGTDESSEVPATVLPLLRRFFAEFGPILADVMDAVAAWVEEHPNAPRLPRTVGRHSFRLGDASSKRMAQSFTQWMWQRPLFAYLGLSDRDRTRADKLLAATGGADVLAKRPGVWLRRVNNRLVASSWDEMAGPGGAIAPAPY